MFPVPIKLEPKELNPIAVFSVPVVFDLKAPSPKALFPPPVVFALKANCPKLVLSVTSDLPLFQTVLSPILNSSNPFAFVLAKTKAVVAIWVVFVPAVAVGAVGVPVSVAPPAYVLATMSPVLLTLKILCDALLKPSNKNPTEAVVPLTLTPLLALLFVTWIAGVPVLLLSKVTPVSKEVFWENILVPAIVWSPVNFTTAALTAVTVGYFKLVPSATKLFCLFAISSFPEISVTKIISPEPNKLLPFIVLIFVPEIKIDCFVFNPTFIASTVANLFPVPSTTKLFCLFILGSLLSSVITILVEPSNDTLLIVIGVCNLVVVVELPVKLPIIIGAVTVPVKIGESILAFKSKPILKKV